MAMVHNPERWQQLSLSVQLANIGSEISRVCSWQERGDSARQEQAAARAFELIELTIADPRWRGRRRELTRLREVTLDAYCGSRQYGVSFNQLQAYYLPYAIRARH